MIEAWINKNMGSKGFTQQHADDAQRCFQIANNMNLNVNVSLYSYMYIYYFRLIIILKNELMLNNVEQLSCHSVGSIRQVRVHTTYLVFQWNYSDHSNQIIYDDISYTVQLV